MKKVIAICLALVMVFALSLTVCAAPGSFVNSPSNNGAPTLIEGKNEDPSCKAGLEIIPYRDRHTLSDDAVAEMEDAYQSISDASDLGDLCDDLKNIANKQNIKTTDLSVSDLFHINMSGCDNHSEHGAFKIKLSADTLKGFVGLMQIIDGKWVLVPGATVEDGKYLVFTAEELSTFAIVVDGTRAVATSPKTGDPFGTCVIALSAFAVLGAMATGAVVIYKKKA